MEKLKLGVSTCLLGENVRYDGQHKHNRYLTGVLGKFVDWFPVCPEVECGMPVPREAMHLAEDIDNPKLVTTKTNEDKTPMMQSWIPGKLEELAKQDLCGFIFKADSPSSGMERVKVYIGKGAPTKKGRGLFAAAFMDRFPLIPVEEDGRLNDAKLRENFIQRIFVYHRWQEMNRAGLCLKALTDFHAHHKYLIMSHKPAAVSELGRMIANLTKDKLEETAEAYFATLMETLKLHATIAKHVNVMEHIRGYFKKQLSPDEKEELSEIIDQYKRELVPLIVPVTLINHYVRKYRDPYLKEQVYLQPHPSELKLRNQC